MHDVLQLDITGLPQAWISVEQAAVHVATRSSPSDQATERVAA